MLPGGLAVLVAVLVDDADAEGPGGVRAAADQPIREQQVRLHADGRHRLRTGGADVVQDELELGEQPHL